MICEHIVFHALGPFLPTKENLIVIAYISHNSKGEGPFLSHDKARSINEWSSQFGMEESD